MMLQFLQPFLTSQLLLLCNPPLTEADKDNLVLSYLPPGKGTLSQATEQKKFMTSNEWIASHVIIIKSILAGSASSLHPPPPSSLPIV